MKNGMKAIYLRLSCHRLLSYSISVRHMQDLQLYTTSLKSRIKLIMNNIITTSKFLSNFADLFLD